MRLVHFVLILGIVLQQGSLAGPRVKANHTRLLVEDVPTMAQRCVGLLSEDYRVVKERADAAVRRGGIELISNPWSIPEDLMNCGLAFLVKQQLGHESRPYADVIIKQWGDGKTISNPQGSHFGYHALAYDWIYEALSAEQRLRYGEALGGWLRFARTLFLHVFEITNEKDQAPTSIKLIEPAGIQISDTWQVRFNTSGSLGGKVGDRALATGIHTESQYQ